MALLAAQTLSLPIMARAAQLPGQRAIVAGGMAYTYGDLLHASEQVASGLLKAPGHVDGGPVAFLVPSSFHYAATLWGIQRAGGIAVPLCVTDPVHEVERVLRDCGARQVVVDPSCTHAAGIRELGSTLGFAPLTVAAMMEAAPTRLPYVGSERAGLMVYTSGSTGRPKGVIHTHAMTQAQVEPLSTAWQWSPHDHILNFLAMHHLHGILNVLTCALWVGATCEMMPRFDAKTVWDRLGAGGVTLFMAVPTIYKRLITAWETAREDERARWSAACKPLRVMISGSESLPHNVLDRWEAISGHRLLERYGMSEFGMGLVPLVRDPRIPGAVGRPLPGMELRLIDEQENDVAPGTRGQIIVRGPAVFRQYWQRPDETAAAFHDGWFYTGDSAILGDRGQYHGVERINGIIKTGGMKVGPREVELDLLEHDAIAECAVIGVDDDQWGQRICAAIVIKPGADLTLDALHAWAKSRMAAHKVPKQVVIVAALPLLGSGKVDKVRLRQMFETAVPQ